MKDNQFTDAKLSFYSWGGLLIFLFSFLPFLLSFLRAFVYWYMARQKGGGHDEADVDG